MSAGDTSVGRRIALVVALGIGAAYAAPLLWPPLGDGLGLLGRLFPGTPDVWIGGRLLALLTAIVVAALALPPSPAAPTSVRASRVSARALQLALALAFGALVGAFVVGRVGRVGQVVWLLSLALPAIALRASGARPAWPSPRAPAGLTAAIVLAWLALRLSLSVASPRAADAVDTWVGFDALVRLAEGGANVVTSSVLVGQSALNSVLQGSLLYSAERPPSFVVLQFVHAGWSALTAALLAWVAGARLGRWAAPVAAAAFLFSPFAALLPLISAPLFVGPLFVAAELALLHRVAAARCEAAAVALAAVGGVASSNPALAPVSLVACGVAAWLLVQARRPLPIAIGLLVFTAGVLPSVPDPDTLGAMVHDFTEARGDWIGLQAVLLGQRTPFDVPGLWNSPAPPAFDVPLGVLLAPFAIARRALRLWGDALLDPATAVLLVFGLAVLLRSWLRHRRDALLVLGLLAAALAPALLSSYDRPSLSRMMGAPALLALVATLGFASLRGAFALRAGPAALATCLAMMLGGTWLFDHANPRILPRSWLGIALEATAHAHPGEVALLTYGGPFDLSWLYVEPIAEQVPGQPATWLRLEDDETLRRAAEEGTSAFLWSPALEADRDVARRVCALWPDVRLEVWWDRPHASRALAAILPDAPSYALAPQSAETRRCTDAPLVPPSLPR